MIIDKEKVVLPLCQLHQHFELVFLANIFCLNVAREKLKSSPGVNFINVLKAAFMLKNLKSIKKTYNLTILLGIFIGTKAACIKKNCARFSYKIAFC